MPQTTQQTYRLPVDLTYDEWIEVSREADAVHLSMGEYLKLCHRAFVNQTRRVGEPQEG